MQSVRERLKLDESSPVLEGTVQESVLKKGGERLESSSKLLLKITGFDGQLSVPGGNFRLDVGERVRLYTLGNFDVPNEAVPYKDEFIVNGVEIMAEDDKVKFSYVNHRKFGKGNELILM